MGRAPILYVKEIFYPILASFGIPANVVTAVILYQGKCGLSRGITRYMMSMAISDLFVLIIHVFLREIYLYYSPNSFLSRSAVCPSYIHLRLLTIDYSVWLTVSFTFDRFVSICCPKLRHKYCTERTATIMIVFLCVLSCFKYIPIHFMYKPSYTTDNVNWGCQPKAVYFTSNWWLAFTWMCSISLSLLPYSIILLLNGLTVRHIIVTGRVRQRLKRQNCKDNETESRHKSIVLLFTVCGTSILLWTTASVTNICTRVTINFQGRDLTSPSAVANEVGLLLIRVSAGANTCTYAMTQSKFRQELKNGIKRLTHVLVMPLNRVKQSS